MYYYLSQSGDGANLHSKETYSSRPREGACYGVLYM